MQDGLSDGQVLRSEWYQAASELRIGSSAHTLLLLRKRKESG